MPFYDMSNDLITLGVYIVRKVVSGYLCCRRVWKSTTSEHMTRSCMTSTRALTAGDAVPKSIVLETWTRGSQTKTWVQYSGDTIVDHSSPFDKSSRAPWSWIGYKTASGDMIDLSYELAHCIVPGNVIKPELIHTLFPRSETGSLVYVDPKTFEVKDLSSDGLVIGDVSSPSSTDTSTPELVSDCGRVRSASAASGTPRVDGDADAVD